MLNAMAAAIRPTGYGRVVGALACQKDSYLRVLETEVVSCVKPPPPKTPQNGSRGKLKASNGAPVQPVASSESWLIEFADSVLFPEGGGQPSDTGTILPLSGPADPIPVSFVQRQGLQCVCHCPTPLEPGTRVRQEVDFRRRWDHMQQHTGQHLLSAVMNSYDGLETVGWGIGADGGMNYVDLARKPSDSEMQEIQDKCNEAIRDNHPITVRTPADAKTSRLPGDYDAEKGIVRTISIGDLDDNTCCGTHLAQTSHISLILLHYPQPVHSTRTRLYFSAGDRAIKISTDSINGLRSVARLISSPSSPGDVLASVKKINDAAADLKRQQKKLLSEIAKWEGDRVKSTLQAGKKAWVYRASEGLDFLNTVVFEVKDAVQQEGGVVVLAGGEGKEGGPLVVFGDKEAVPELVAKIKETVKNLKGGGKGERWQGKVSEWEKGEIEALQLLVEDS